MTNAGLTYAEVGASAGALPAGYHHVRRSATLGQGRELFDRASCRLLAWDMHRGAGLTVPEGSLPAAEGVGIELVWRVGPIAITLPCRVVLVEDTPTRRGFTYGTLAGHPERGEESFAVVMDDSERVSIEIVASSRPARWYSRLGGPVSKLVQARFTGRYLKALRD